MVVSLKQSTRYILKAIPFTKINHQIVQDCVLSCLSILTKVNFTIRAVFCDNHSTNVSAYKHLKELQVNLPKRHLRVTATSDIRQLSELPIEIFNTKLPPSSGNLREAAQNHSPDGCRFGKFTCISMLNT